MKLSKSTQQQVVRFYSQHVRKYPKYLLGIVVSVPLTVLVNNFLPTLIAASVLSRLSQHQYVSHQLWHSFGPELVLYFGLILTGVLTWRMVDYFAWQLEIRIQRNLAEEVFDKLLHQTADFHANSFSGSLVSHTNKLLSSYIRLADTTLFQVYPMVCSIIFACAFLLFRSWLFVVLLLVFSVAYLAVALKLSKPVRQAGAEVASAESAQTGYLADAVSNNLAIKSYAGGSYERERFSKATRHTQRKVRELIVKHQLQMAYLGASSRIISASSLAVAVISVMTYHANIGTVFLILSYTGSIVEQLFQFGNNSLRSYNRALGDARDMVETLALVPTVQDDPNARSWQPGRGDIAWRNVTFTHAGAGDAIFDKLNLHIKPGEKVGLVGHSGSGKTTFTRLLLRFSNIDGGEIRIDGQNIAEITQDDLHRAIAYVPQEPLLFHRTIQENIAYGNPAAGQAAIEAAARMASAHDFISLLPQGYETLVGERGVKLSGGQRQRIAIARALLKNAPILVLDEATSALDSESEALIQEALWQLMQNRTAIVIAHRLSTIQRMDRIIVLDDGKVVEEGSHKELVSKKNGVYAKLWARQSGGFIED